MQRPLFANIVLTLFIGLPSAAMAAGSAENPAPAPPAIATWTVVAGHQRLSIRDIARSGPPVEASPVAREGSGPMLHVSYRRARPDRLHRVDFAAASTGSFSYVTGIRTTSLPPGDAAARLEGRYEYRRYPFRDLGVRGLDLGVGVQAIADRLSIERRLPPAITIIDSAARGGAAIVAAARLRRWEPLTIEAAWINAAMIGGVTERHSAAAKAAGRNWGPGWLTDLEVRAVARVTARMQFVASYVHGNEGLISTRPGIAMVRHHVAAGVAYGR
jgi:hypothetical protein